MKSSRGMGGGAFGDGGFRNDASCHKAGHERAKIRPSIWQKRARRTGLRWAGSATSFANARDMALETINEAISVYNNRQQLVYWNGRYAEIYGLDPGQLRIGMTLREVIDLRYQKGTGPKVTSANYRTWLSGLVASSAAADTEVVMANGKVYALHHRPMPDGGFVGTSTDITARHHAERRLQHLALHDTLTGLPNRSQFFERMDRSIAWLRGAGALDLQCPRAAADDRLLGLMLLDVDNFKVINDTMGHRLGDELLRQVTQRIRACLRETDVFARLGGDEFAILLDTGLTVPEQVRAVAREVIGSMARPFTLSNSEVAVGVTIGYTTADCVVSPADPAKLLSQADLALYHAKQQQRGSCCAFEFAMEVALKRRTELERDLRRAISEETLEVHFQPMFRLPGGRLVGAEALVRWTHPQHGVIPPSEFIPMAETAGLIADLGSWVLTTACARAAGWGDLTVAVNLSPEQVTRSDLIEVVQRALRETGLPARRLELEITEGVLVRDTQRTASKLSCLRKLGIGIALDDFGTGYSSLSYLRKFPFSKLKIDRSFIEPMQSDAGTAAIVQAIASLGRSLNMKVVAEGIETEAQLQQIQSLGCDEGQGYLLGRPCSAELFEGVLETHRSIRLASTTAVNFADSGTGARFGDPGALAVEWTPALSGGNKADGLYDTG